MRDMANGTAPPRGLVTVRLGQQFGFARRPAPPVRRQQLQRPEPQNAMTLTARGDALRLVGRFREAVALFDRAIAIAPQAVAAWFGRALAHQSCGALVEAERDYRRVTELAPRTAHGFAGLATVLAMAGRLDEARVFADRAAELGPDDSATVIAQARCDRLAGDHAAAARRLEALTSRPGLAPQDAVLALGLLGDALDRLNECDRAFEAYARANRRFVAAHVSPGLG
ncbi:MAG: tetratricopeptide repeat protein [Proteobacteria bacterium]|nr:tetratricopeptide repeat protein [Pseudomonadota bacterium]